MIKFHYGYREITSNSWPGAFQPGFSSIGENPIDTSPDDTGGGELDTKIYVAPIGFGGAGGPNQGYVKTDPFDNIEDALNALGTVGGSSPETRITIQIMRNGAPDNPAFDYELDFAQPIIIEGQTSTFSSSGTVQFQTENVIDYAIIILDFGLGMGGADELYTVNCGFILNDCILNLVAGEMSNGFVLGGQGGLSECACLIAGPGNMEFKSMIFDRAASTYSPIRIRKQSAGTGVSFFACVFMGSASDLGSDIQPTMVRYEYPTADDGKTVRVEYINCTMWTPTIERPLVFRMPLEDFTIIVETSASGNPTNTGYESDIRSSIIANYRYFVKDSNFATGTGNFIRPEQIRKTWYNFDAYVTSDGQEYSILGTPNNPWPAISDVLFEEIPTTTPVLFQDEKGLEIDYLDYWGNTPLNPATYTLGDAAQVLRFADYLRLRISGESFNGLEFYIDAPLNGLGAGAWRTIKNKFGYAFDSQLEIKNPAKTLNIVDSPVALLNQKDINGDSHKDYDNINKKITLNYPDVPSNDNMQKIRYLISLRTPIRFYPLGDAPGTTLYRQGVTGSISINSNNQIILTPFPIDPPLVPNNWKGFYALLDDGSDTGYYYIESNSESELILSNPFEESVTIGTTPTPISFYIDHILVLPELTEYSYNQEYYTDFEKGGGFAEEETFQAFGYTGYTLILNECKFPRVF